MNILNPFFFKKFPKYRSIRPALFCKKTFLRPATFLKRRLRHRCLPLNFAKFLRVPPVAVYINNETFPDNEFFYEVSQIHADGEETDIISYILKCLLKFNSFYVFMLLKQVENSNFIWFTFVSNTRQI